IIEAEFDEIDEAGEELDFAKDGDLPWLEADEGVEEAGGVDTAQLVGFVAVLLAVLLVVVGGVWYVNNSGGGPAQIADGSTIEAPEGPYKERPEDAGGKQFPGTNDVAPGVAQGQSSEGRLASGTGVGAGAGGGDQNLDIAMPPIAGGGDRVTGPAGASGAQSQSAASTSGSSAASSASTPPATSGASTRSGGVGVQLAAYSSRARADKGWRDLQRQSAALKGLEYRVVEGRIDIGTVYRLQAISATRAEADALCRTLKSQGLDCQVKP
ncbi:MAG: SPOR domain-containing protein, partial [Pseudomonadota bacterium]